MCGECAGCLWARERYAMSALRCFITSKTKLKERKKTDTPREGWENGTPPPHRDFKERGVVR